MESVIAEKYAVALLQVAQEQKTVDDIAAEMLIIDQTVEAAEHFEAFKFREMLVDREPVADLIERRHVAWVHDA